jgi:hypothetical protein
MEGNFFEEKESKSFITGASPVTMRNFHPYSGNHFGEIFIEAEGNVFPVVLTSRI